MVTFLAALGVLLSIVFVFGIAWMLGYSCAHHDWKNGQAPFVDSERGRR